MGVDGKPVWIALGLAPSPHCAAPRRRRVPVDYPPGLNVPQGGPVYDPPPFASRWAVVPKGTRKREEGALPSVRGG